VRWAAIGAAVAVALGGTTIGVVRATTGGTTSALVPITPCRLLDTRPGARVNVGPRATPIGAQETYTLAARGEVGNCLIPNDATGLVINTTAVSPSAASFITVFPGGDPLPLAASLNTVAGGPPTPNLVTVAVKTPGTISIYNNSGTVDIVGDVVGYYVASPVGPGPQGPIGPPGPSGAQGPVGPPSRLTPTQLAQLRWDLDPSRPAKIAVGLQPSWLGYDGQSIWIGADAVFQTISQVVRYDPSTGIPHQVVTPVNATGGFAFDGTSMWVAGLGAVMEFTTSGTLVRTIPVGGSIRGMAFDGQRIWAAAPGANRVFRIDRTTGAVTSTSLAGSPMQVLFDGTSIWVSRYDAGIVTRFDTNGAVIGNVTIGGNTMGLGYDGRDVYVADELGNKVHRIDIVTETQVQVATPSIAGAWGIAFDGRRLWVTGSAAGSIGEYGLSGELLSSFGDMIGPRAVLFDGRNVWVAASDGVYRYRAG
jgi:sugar lactone lactonase YvrE